MMLVLLVVAALFTLVLQRQGRMQEDVEGVSREAMQSIVADGLRRRGEGAASQLTLSMANPLYYFDLDTIGELSRAALRQPATRYVIVFDAQGLIVHDGSDEIASYGQAMSDDLASGAVAAREMHTQFNGVVMDVSAPILIGSERIGGVRIGFDLQDSRDLQNRAVADLRARLDELGKRQLWWLGVISAALLAFGAIMVWLIQRWLVRPIDELARSARAIESGQFDVSTPISLRNDELGDLTRTFARMSQSVARHDRDIRHMAYSDALTGLSNRLAFREALDRRLLQSDGAGLQLGLLFADIDDFKRVNDTFGHDAGDEVLLQFAGRIRAAAAEHGGPDAMVARFGGDEFVILVQGGTTAATNVRILATQLADMLVSELGQPIAVRDRQVFLSTSIGITLFPEDASGASTLMKNGDIAMYQAKLAGKNCYRFYSRAMDQAAERRSQMEHELRGAWERGELSLAYQPVYRMGDHAMIGAEALLRWKHPEHGMVAPSVFIDIAEQSGLIEVLGPQVLRQACRDAAGWQRAFRGSEPLFVAVNVSPRQLRSGDLPKIVARCLSEAGLDPRRLHLELTETAVLGDEVHASRLLSQLRETGVKVWLDDFGTGFSGLSHLRRVPMDGVKIDRSFVADILCDPDDLALTTAIIAMAHSLGITVVAEGVETEGQFVMLRDRGCDLAQGFWLGMPVPVAEFTEVIDASTVAPTRA
ncbi:MAG: EAL domain-containing protein [Lysobacter sp.]|nr:EAL domain-containing protein [Lysobacter sp.]